MYLLAGLLAAALKQHYSTAEPYQLKWILAPTAWLVSLVTSKTFTFSAGEGFVSSSGAIVIAPACAGLNFLIICYCTLAFSFMHYAKNSARRLAVIISSLLASACLTFLVNTARIALSISHVASSSGSALLSAESIHRLEGICIYFLALSVIYCLSALLARRYLDNSRPIRLSLLIPLFWYVSIMIGIPILRGSYQDNLPAFIEHCSATLIVPILLMLTARSTAWIYHQIRMSTLTKRSAFTAACVAPLALLCLWSPLPDVQSFDTGSNGIWLSGKWYTGIDSQSQTELTTADMTSLISDLRDNHIRYAYVRAGHIASNGMLEHIPSSAFFDLQNKASDITFLPWIAGDGDHVRLEDPHWRDEFIQQLGILYAAGVKGIHLNIEPIHDNREAYVDLLREIRERFDGNFFVSHATVRIAPMGIAGSAMKDDFWSRDFYRAAMQHSDQTVLMGYNTALPSAKIYRAYMGHQTGKLLDWASDIEGHQILIGIPCYEGISRVSNPRVENIPNAIAGISSALISRPSLPSHFKGTALYANWHLSESEATAYQKCWIKQRPADRIQTSLDLPVIN